MNTMAKAPWQCHCFSQRPAALWLMLVVSFRFFEWGLGQGTTFQFNQFSQNGSSLSLLGDASVAQNDLALELTKNSTGRAVYKNPILFKDPTTQATISFTTSFIFSIETGNNTANTAEGFAFLIAPDNLTIGSGGEWMGLMAPVDNMSSSATPNAGVKTVAVEFDVQKNVDFWDISNNHVGVDVNTLNSVFARDAASGTQSVSLLSGHIKAWVDYDGSGRKMQVSLTPYAANNDYPKPSDPLIALDLDLSGVVNEYMFVGFSAATQSGTVQHKIWSWTFESSTGDAGGFGSDFSPTPAPSIPSRPANGASDVAALIATTSLTFLSVALPLALVMLSQ